MGVCCFTQGKKKISSILRKRLPYVLVDAVLDILMKEGKGVGKIVRMRSSADVYVSSYL